MPLSSYQPTQYEALGAHFSSKKHENAKTSRKSQLFSIFSQNIDVKCFRASKTLQNVRKTSFLCYDNYTLSVEDQKRKNHVFSKNHSSASNFSTKPMDFACKSSQKGGTVSDFKCPREVGASPNPWGL